MPNSVDIASEFKALRKELKSSVNELRTELKNSVDELRSEFRTELKSSVNAILHRVGAIESDISVIKEDVANLKGDMATVKTYMKHTSDAHENKWTHELMERLPRDLVTHRAVLLPWREVHASTGPC